MFAYILSAVAVIIALLSLYFSHLQKAKIKIHLRELISFWYFQKKPRIDLDLTFINDGMRSGIVTKVVLEIYNKNNPHKKYILDWKSFYKTIFKDDEIKSVPEDFPYPLYIPGKSSIRKIISFESSEDFYFKEGNWIIMTKLLLKSKDIESPDLSIKKITSLDEMDAIFLVDIYEGRNTNSLDKLLS